MFNLRTCLPTKLILLPIVCIFSNINAQLNNQGDGFNPPPAVISKNGLSDPLSPVESVEYGTLSCRSFLKTEDHHNYDEMTDFLKCLNDTTSLSGKVHLYSIGQSNQGRELWVLAIAKNNANQYIHGRPEVKYVANMHGNEVVGKELLLRFAYEMLFDRLDDNLMDKTRIHLLFSLNPDGYELAATNPSDYLLGRENANSVDLNRDFPDLDQVICAEKDYDLPERILKKRKRREVEDNRFSLEDLLEQQFRKRASEIFNGNIDFNDYTDNDPYSYLSNYALNESPEEFSKRDDFYEDNSYSEEYKPSYFSSNFINDYSLNNLESSLIKKSLQPETEAMITWLNNNNFILSANLHGGDLVANYPFDSSCQVFDQLEPDGQPQYVQEYNASPDDTLFKMLAHSYANAHFNMSQSEAGSACDKRDFIAFNNGTTNGAKWYSVPGGMQDFNYLNNNCFEITLELGCDKFPKSSDLPIYWERNKNALVRYLKNVFCSVSGNVSFILDQKSLMHVPNALIEVYLPEADNPKFPSKTLAGISTRASATGSYIRLLPPGDYFIRARIPGNNYQENEYNSDSINSKIYSDFEKVKIPSNCHAGGNIAVLKDLSIVTEYPISRLIDVLSYGR